LLQRQPTEAVLFRLGRRVPLYHRVLFHPVKKHQKALRQFRQRLVMVGKRLCDAEYGIVHCRLTAG
jgi:hypothetical protein